MNWLESLIVKLGRWVAPALICGWFTAERGEKHREADRLRWWRFKEQALHTKGKVDDSIAEYLRARFNYHDSPDTKLHQKMLDKINLSQYSGEHQP